MKDIEHLLYKASHEVSMSENEQERVRSLLKTSMMISPFVFRVIPSSYFSYSLFFIQKHTVSVAVVAIIFFSGTMSVFADKSLPGDPLFGVKTGVNEKVLSWFATTPYDKAQLAVMLAERRISEAEKIETDSNVASNVKENHQALLDKQIKIADDDTRLLEVADEIDDLSEVRAVETVLMAQLKTSLNPEDKNSRIKNLREKINFLHDEVSSTSGDSNERNKSLRTKTRLISAKKLLLNASSRNSSTTEDEINSAEEIVSSIESFSNRKTLKSGNNNSETRLSPQTGGYRENDKSGIIAPSNSPYKINKNIDDSKAEKSTDDEVKGD